MIDFQAELRRPPDEKGAAVRARAQRKVGF